MKDAAPNRLMSRVAPHLERGRDEVELQAVGHEQVDRGEALGERLSPELQGWRDERLAARLRARDGEVWVAGGCARLFSATRARDAHGVARLQAIFLPVSTVCLTETTYVTASWQATEHGTSRVYGHHRSEPTAQRLHGSLAELVAGRDGDEAPADDGEPWPAHLDPEALAGRTHWVTELLLGAQLTTGGSEGLFYDRLAQIPAWSTWERERTLLADWPHLQAYWLVHHMLLGNRSAQAEVLAVADDRYPPIVELRALCRAFDEGAEPDQLVSHAALQALRVDLVAGSGAGMSDEAIAEVQAQLAQRERWAAQAASTLIHLRTRVDDGTQRALQAWDLLSRCAGALAASERHLIDVWACNDTDRATRHGRLASGETTPLIRPMNSLLQEVDTTWLPLFEAAFALGAGVDEDHADAAPGALVGWGKALGSFSALHRAFQAVGRTAGRRRFLELAMVADHFYDDDEAAEPFLVAELHDFAKELGSREHGTTSFAFFALLERRHPEALRLARALCGRGPLNDATRPTLLALVDLVEARELGELAEGLQALQRRGLGRDDDGSAAMLRRAQARLAGAEG